MKLRNTIIGLTFFSVAMGLLEAVVVIYLRIIYYPDGFDFPLKIIAHDVAVIEFCREVATMVMLLAVAWIAGKTKATRFGWFLFCFAVWDIFYYVFLYVFLGWPESPMTWDVLFLIPVPWVGPVISPVIIATGMIIFAVLIARFEAAGKNAFPRFREWLLFGLGSLVVIISWTWDYCRHLWESDANASIWTLSDVGDLFTGAEEYMPETFNWPVFLVGTGMLFAGLVLYYRRVARS